MKLKLFEEFSINDRSRDLDNLRDLVLDSDLEFEVFECNSEFIRISKLSEIFKGMDVNVEDLIGGDNRNKWIEISILGSGDPNDDFIKIIFSKSKELSDLSNWKFDHTLNRWPKTGSTKLLSLSEINNKIKEINNEVVDNLNKTKFISRIKHLTHYSLSGSTYVDIIDDNYNITDGWGIKLFLEHKL